MNGRRPGNPAFHPKGVAGSCRKNAALDRLSARASTSIVLDINNHVSFKLQARRSGGSPPPSRRCGDSGSSPDAPFPERRGGLSRQRRGNRSPGLAIRLACCNWLQDLCWEGA